VPDFLVTVGATAQFPSGVALAAAQEPLARARQKRIAINTGTMARRFDLERALINADAGAVVIGPDVIETWRPKPRAVVQDPTEVVNRVRAKLDGRLTTYLEAVRELEGLSTDAEARRLIESREAAEDELEAALPDLDTGGGATAQPQAGSLLGRLASVTGGR